MGVIFGKFDSICSFSQAFAVCDTTTVLYILRRSGSSIELNFFGLGGAHGHAHTGEEL